MNIGQDPELSKGAGVYLHILWRESDPSRFWLYVGQALIFCVRINNHNDPVRRRKNPCLHYSVWDSAPEMQSRFVTLLTLSQPECHQSHLILNMAEMWMSLVFQTLTGLHLEQFLPDGMTVAWLGYHLNVALPLWQGFTDSKENQAIREATGGRLGF